MRAPTACLPDDDDPGPLPDRRRPAAARRRAGGSSRRGAPSPGPAPYLEQASFYNAINFEPDLQRPDEHDGRSYTPCRSSICPSDPGSHIDDATLGQHGRRHDQLRHLRRRLVCLTRSIGARPNSVGPRNRTLFGPNYSRKIAEVTDGLSNTLMASEGLIGHAQMRSCLTSPAVPSDASVGTWTPVPTSPCPARTRPAALMALINSCSTGTGEGQGGRADRPHPDGATAACTTRGSPPPCPPNQNVADHQPGHGGPRSPARSSPWIGTRKTRTTAAPTYMSLAASSRHPGGVNALFADGSVHFIKSTVNPVTWRALGSVQGGEVISSDAY